MTKIEDIFKNCLAEIEHKTDEYGALDSSKDHEDIANSEGRIAPEVCFTLLMKHIIVLKRIAKNPKAFTLKLVGHRVMDGINYLGILQNEIEKYIERGDNESTKL